MAAEHSDYSRGEMPVDAHRGTFGGFMAGTTYGSAFIIVSLLMPTLVFGANLGWLPSLIASLVVAIILGMALKLKGAWYASMIALAVITGVLCLFFTAIT